MTRPVRLSSHRVIIRAPRELVYQKMSSFGRGRLQGNSGESSRVVYRSGNTIVAEFNTRAGRLTVTTLEEVTLDPPSRLTFRHLRGPLHYALERFVLTDVDGDTALEHSGEFVWSRLPVLGWLAGRLLIKRPFERVLERHMDEIKTGCESRARRSHVFPLRSARGLTTESTEITEK